MLTTYSSRTRKSILCSIELLIARCSMPHQVPNAKSLSCLSPPRHLASCPHPFLSSPASCIPVRHPFSSPVMMTIGWNLLSRLHASDSACRSSLSRRPYLWTTVPRPSSNSRQPPTPTTIHCRSTSIVGRTGSIAQRPSSVEHSPLLNGIERRMSVLGHPTCCCRVSMNNNASSDVLRCACRRLFDHTLSIPSQTTQGTLCIFLVLVPPPPTSSILSTLPAVATSEPEDGKKHEALFRPDIGLVNSGPRGRTAMTRGLDRVDRLQPNVDGHSIWTRCIRALSPQRQTRQQGPALRSPIIRLDHHHHHPYLGIRSDRDRKTCRSRVNRNCSSPVLLCRFLVSLSHL